METHKFDIAIDIAGDRIVFACEATYFFADGETTIRSVTGRRVKFCTKTNTETPWGPEIDLTDALNCGALADEITALEEQERQYASESARTNRYAMEREEA